MISRIHGLLIEKKPPVIIIDVQGIGYEVEVSMNTFYQLPELNQLITLHIHFVVREDAQLLFGFYQAQERELFRQLIKVNGVGPRLALSILSSMTPDEFVLEIQQGESNHLVKIPGVGKKTAERLMIEMRDRLKSWDQTNPSNLTIDRNLSMTSGTDPVRISEREAIHALVSLGYKPQEASRMIGKLDITNLSVEQIIRQALRSTTADV